MDKAEEVGVHGYVVAPPIVCHDVEEPWKQNLEIDHPTWLAAGKTRHSRPCQRWSVCQLDDLVSFYPLILDKIASGEYLPSGKCGFYFCETRILTVVCITDRQPCFAQLKGGNSRLIEWEPKYEAENFITEVQMKLECILHYNRDHIRTRSRCCNAFLWRIRRFTGLWLNVEHCVRYWR
ncbi:hypothetical protein BDN67DRAFT_79699 [Paxillus ammoniavirescens]|nr:hypothetical protein BDN67DRAFT_79699 [Paxillus ammoniavirescens]